QVEEDRAGLEQRIGLAARSVLIDYRRNHVVGVDLEKLGLELFAPGDIDGNYPVRQPRFFTENRNLMTVGRVVVIEVDHFSSPNRGTGQTVADGGQGRPPHLAVATADFRSPPRGSQFFTSQPRLR